MRKLCQRRYEGPDICYQAFSGLRATERRAFLQVALPVRDNNPADMQFMPQLYSSHSLYHSSCT